MKALIAKIIALPLWAKVASVCVALVLLTGGVAVTVIYVLPNVALSSESSETASSAGSSKTGNNSDVHLEADSTDISDGATETQDNTADGSEGKGDGSEEPSGEAPTEKPTEAPTEKPTQKPTQKPTEKPTKKPTQNKPTNSDEPTEESTEEDPEGDDESTYGAFEPVAPTEEPTEAPTEEPTERPTQKPTEKPTEAPTEKPTEKPTEAPTERPTQKPTQKPTEAPTEKPTQKPTEKPTEAPTEKPTEKPTEPTTKPAKSSAPTVTLCTQVGPGKMVVAGSCSINTEYLRVSGSGVTTLDIYPDKSSSKSYFIGTVKYSKATTVNIQVKESGKELSDVVANKIGYSSSMKDYMTSDEYMPVFSKDSRMHFYSALLCYTLSGKVSSSVKATAKNNITDTVNKAKAVGAEVIYLVVPSSAWVYPETVPDEYKKATGETVYQAFKNVAQSSGATVIYPLDTMLAHKNDGFKIYHNTDSHWSTYGAYWGLYALMNYISQDYPKAKPRTLAEMKFYNKEMYAGDALFSFPDGMGFDKIQNGSSWNGATSNTKMKELAPLYEMKFGTNTLYSVFRNNRSVYLNWGNGEATTVSGGGSGLPTAMVMRDSFGGTIFDMLSDRFSTVYWRSSGDYRVSSSALEDASPDYLIYVISERNLLKVMTNNENASITSLR